MDLRKIISKFINIMVVSYKLPIIIPTLLGVILYAVSIKLDIALNESKFIEVLNGIGLLSTFLIFVVEKIDYQFLNRILIEDGKILGIYDKKLQWLKYRQSLLLRHTIFSYVIIIIILIFIEYFLYSIGKMNLFLLYCLMCYIFLGFIICIGIWDYIAKHNKKQD